MATRGFVRTLAFGAAAGALWPLLFGAGCRLLGWDLAWSLGLTGLAAAYTAGLAPHARGALASAGVTTLLGAATHLLWPEPFAAAAAAAVAIALLRSHWLDVVRHGLRAIWLAAMLLSGGLLSAWAAFFPGPLGGAAALWAFFLVQSLYFARVGPVPRRRSPTLEDPFEEALRRAYPDRPYLRVRGPSVTGAGVQPADD